MGNPETKKLIISYFDFIIGSAETHHCVTGLKRFIDKRSRVVDLLQMREFHAVIKSGYKKRELVEFFCNLKAFERKRLLENIPDIIVSLPYDFKLFKLNRPQHIAYRSTNFGGTTVEYPVYSILSFLEELNKTSIKE